MMNRRFMCMVTAIVMLLWAGAAAAQPPTHKLKRRMYV